MTKPPPNYTDIRTGIVYTHIANKPHPTPSSDSMQPHLDAFIPPAFLKTYFGKSKSNSEPASI